MMYKNKKKTKFLKSTIGALATLAASLSVMSFIFCGCTTSKTQETPSQNQTSNDNPTNQNSTPNNNTSNSNSSKVEEVVVFDIDSAVEKAAIDARLISDEVFTFSEDSTLNKFELTEQEVKDNYNDGSLSVYYNVDGANSTTFDFYFDSLENSKVATESEKTQVKYEYVTNYENENYLNYVQKITENSQKIEDFVKNCAKNSAVATVEEKISAEDVPSNMNKISIVYSDGNTTYNTLEKMLLENGFVWYDDINSLSIIYNEEFVSAGQTRIDEYKAEVKAEQEALEKELNSSATQQEIFQGLQDLMDRYRYKNSSSLLASYTFTPIAFTIIDKRIHIFNRVIINSENYLDDTSFSFNSSTLKLKKDLITLSEVDIDTEHLENMCSIKISTEDSSEKSNLISAAKVITGNNTINFAAMTKGNNTLSDFGRSYQKEYVIISNNYKNIEFGWVVYPLNSSDYVTNITNNKFEKYDYTTYTLNSNEVNFVKYTARLKILPMSEKVDMIIDRTREDYV